MSDSRTKNTVKSTLTNILEQLFLLVYGLFIPRLIIQTYGSEVNGLTAFIQQFLNVFQLLQAGTVGASIYQLYKPIATNDYEQINIIVDASKKFFFKVGNVFMVLVLLLIPLICYLQKDSSFTKMELIITTIIMGINGLLTFCFDARYDIVISSYQKRYIMSFARLINKIIYCILVICVVYFKKYYIYLYLSSLIAKIFAIFIMRHNYKKISFCWGKKLKVNNYKIPNRLYIFSTQIAFQIISVAPLLFVSLFHNLSEVSVYSINFVIASLIQMIITAFVQSVTEPLANYKQLNSEKNTELLYDVIVKGVFLCVTLFSTCLCCLETSFMNIYMGGIKEVQYVRPIFSISLTLYVFSFSTYLLLNLLVDIQGLFKEIYRYPIIALIFTIPLLFLFAYFFDVEYVIFGYSLFYFIITFFYLYNISKKSQLLNKKKFFLYLCISILVISFVRIIFSPFVGRNFKIFEWILFAFVVFLTTMIIEFIILLIVDKNFILLIKSKIINMFKEKINE